MTVDETSRQDLSAQDELSDFSLEERDLQATMMWLFSVIMNRKWLIIFVFCFIVFAGVLFTIRQQKIYNGVAIVEVTNQADQVLSDVREVHTMGGGWNYYDSMVYFSSQAHIIKSRTVADMVVKKLHLDNDLSFLGLENIEDPALLEKKLAEADPAGMLQNQIMVNTIKETRLIEIEYQHRNAQLATDITNAVAEAYVEQNLLRKIESTRSAIVWLKDQMTDARKQLEKSDKDLYDFKVQNNILTTSLDERVNLVSSKLNELNRYLEQARNEMLVAKEKYQAVSSTDLEENLDRFSSLKFVSNELISKLKDNYLSAQRKVDHLAERYKDQHPIMKTAQTELAAAKRFYRDEVKNVLDSIRVDASVKERTFLAIKQQVENLKEQAQEMNQWEMDYKQLLRDRDSNQQLYDMLVNRLKESDLTLMVRTNNIRVVERAQKALAPVKPRVRLNLLFTLFLAVVLSIGSAILRDKLDNTLKTPEQIKQLSKVNLLGFFPKLGLGKKEIPESEVYVLDNPRGTIAESLRVVRTNLSFISPQKPIQAMLVTSASPQEGKTSVVCNLGVTIAKSNVKTLLIDTDMRRPRLHKVFKFKNDVGISNLIIGNKTLDQVTKKLPGVEHLDILTCGPIPPNPSELISTERFKELVADLRTKYDRIIFDSPPIVAVTDAAILSNLVDAVVLVVKSNSTTRGLLKQAVSQLSNVKANLVGYILNNIDLNRKGYRGYYNYYYYSSYYGPDTDGKDDGSTKKLSHEDISGVT